MSLRTFFGLVSCNLIWSAHPMMGKWLLEVVTPSQAAWLRYGGALIGYWVLIGLAQILRSKSSPKLKGFIIPKLTRDRIYLLLLGILAFGLGPLIQMSGLSTSLATENALIVAMEPLVTVVFAGLILNEKFLRLDLFGLLLGLLGFGFLAGFNPLTLSLTQDRSHWVGNCLLFFSLGGEAAYTVLGKKLIKTYPPLGVFGSGLTLGVVFLSMAILTSTIFYATVSQAGSTSWGAALPRFELFTWKTWFSIFWLGPLGTAGAYLYFMFILVQVPVMSATLFLFLQPLAGALWSYLLLGDQLSSLQYLGSGLILLGVLFPNLLRIKKRSTR